jgi:hypothetical protein
VNDASPSVFRVDTKDALSLFRTLFAPLYPPEALADLEKARQEDANPAKNPRLFALLSQAAEAFAEQMNKSVQSEIPLDLDGSDASIHRLSAALTPERRAQWLANVGPDGVPELAHVLIHGALYLGEAVVKNHHGVWKMRNPHWDSLITLESRAGTGDLAPFSWLLRALCDEEIGRDTLAHRYRTHVELPCLSPEELPVFLTLERSLPRLKKPRYDTLHKYLRAHLPELVDLGKDFPSPERFDELSFAWLEPIILGGGRMVLLHGPSAEGAMLMWLDETGFQKSAYYAGDVFPEHRVKVDGDKLQIIVSVLNRPVMHEVLWWGP